MILTQHSTDRVSHLLSPYLQEVSREASPRSGLFSFLRSQYHKSAGFFSIFHRRMVNRPEKKMVQHKVVQIPEKKSRRSTNRDRSKDLSFQGVNLVLSQCWISYSHGHLEMWISKKLSTLLPTRKSVYCS